MKRRVERLRSNRLGTLNGTPADKGRRESRVSFQCGGSPRQQPSPNAQLLPMNSKLESSPHATRTEEHQHGFAANFAGPTFEFDFIVVELHPIRRKMLNSDM
ncbi:hypothetical protein PI124_g20765 [Phytophthora idaei]|nr:hypothetical protein PI125_g14970 [Phytophthora idaei]KAG3144713.1 hypothetical protein PI126_g14032 [Phytophthora idaei]KAG3234177.1 hypothetical protein PI124_g20765 [Phytophthora idaei]